MRNEWLKTSRGAGGTAPAYIETPLLESLPADHKRAPVARHPLDRLGQPEEVAPLVCFRFWCTGRGAARNGASNSPAFVRRAGSDGGGIRPLAKGEGTLGDSLFQSILDVRERDPLDGERRKPPAVFHDLHLGQIVDAATAAWEDYDLRPFLNSPLANLDAIAYRQEAMRDLENEAVHGSVEAFSKCLRTMRGYLGLATTLS